MKCYLLFREQYGPYVAWTDEALADEFEDYLTGGPYVLYNLRSDERCSESAEDAKVEFFFGTLADPGKVRRTVERFIAEKYSKELGRIIDLRVHRQYPVHNNLDEGNRMGPTRY